MDARITQCAAVLALVAGSLACKDSALAPRRETRVARPAFATVADSTLPDSSPRSHQYHFVANGDNATANWYYYDGSSYGYGYLNVSRGGSTKAPQTNLYFYQYSCSYYSCTYSYGNGLIPNKDFTGGGRTALHLNTNTATNPNFYTYPGPGGLVVVDWKADGAYQRTQTGSSTYRYGDYFMEKTQGSSSYASAAVSGSVYGVAIGPYPSGEIGTSHNVTIDIYH